MKHEPLARRRALFALGLLATLVLALFALAAWPVAAAGIAVTSAADTMANDGQCTLREAIIAANTDTASGAAGGECAAGNGADTINFAVGGPFTLSSQLPAVTTPITIDGNGPTQTIIQASTCNPITLPGGCAPATYRVLAIDPTGDLTLDGVTVRYGGSDGSFQGGGVLNNGTLTVTNSTFTGNRAWYGAAIAATGTTTLSNSTITGNTPANSHSTGLYNNGGALTINNSTLTQNGQGVIFNAAGTVTVNNSTISANSGLSFSQLIVYNEDVLNINVSTIAGNNAILGIVFNGGTATVSRSTISGNSNSTYGNLINQGSLTVVNSTVSGNQGSSGIFNHSASTLAVANSTITGNTADSKGGGIANFGTATLARSLVAGNSAKSGGSEIFYDPGQGGSLLANAHNVLGHAGQTTAAAFKGFSPGPADFNASSDASNVALGSILSTTLANNGGPTQTHALAAGSPAEDLAPSANCTAATTGGVDQRGEARPQGAGCDAGAYEIMTGTAAPTATPTGILPTATSTPTSTGTATTSPTATPTASPTVTGTPPTATPTASPIASPTASPIASPTATPTTPPLGYSLFAPIVIRP